MCISYSSYIYGMGEVLFFDSQCDMLSHMMDESVEVEGEILAKEELEQLKVALQTLKKEEYTLLVELYIKEQPLNYLATCKSMSYKALTCKKYYILKKLKRYFEENENPFRIYKV